MLRRQLAPASSDSSIGTPATQTCCAAAGSTQIRPNHQPNVDCEVLRNDVLVMRVQLLPLFVEVQKPRKLPVVSAAIAYSRLGLDRRDRDPHPAEVRAAGAALPVAAVRFLVHCGRQRAHLRAAGRRAPAHRRDGASGLGLDTFSSQLGGQP